MEQAAILADGLRDGQLQQSLALFCKVELAAPRCSRPTAAASPSWASRRASDACLSGTLNLGFPSMSWLTAAASPLASRRASHFL